MDERRIKNPEPAPSEPTINSATFFAERRNRADFKTFDRIMRRKGGEPPAPDDTI